VGADVLEHLPARGATEDDVLGLVDHRRALAQLEDEQRNVLRLLFHDELTLQQIADRIGCDVLDVARVRNQALATMRAWLTG